MALITADILNEDCSDISDWTDSDYGTAVSKVDPAGQFRFDTGVSAAGNYFAGIYKGLSSTPTQNSIMIKTRFDAIGTKNDFDFFELVYDRYVQTGTTLECPQLRVRFCSDGLYVYDDTSYIEAGSDVVKCNLEAEWQTWIFQWNYSNGLSTTVDIYVKNEADSSFTFIGTVSASYDTGRSNGRLQLIQRGNTTDNRITHVELIKVGTGLGFFAPIVTTQSGSSISTSGFTCNGNISDLGSYTITRRGFCYKQGTSGDPTISDSVVYDDGSYGIGTYTKVITGLPAGISYRVRSYVVSNSEITYGETVAVQTLPLTLSLSDTFTLSDEFSRIIDFNRQFNDSFILSEGTTLDPSYDLSSIEVTPYYPIMTINQSQQTGAIGHYNFSSDMNLTQLATWFSSNPDVATIDSNGLIIAISSGITFIRVTYGSVSTYIMLRVEDFSPITTITGEYTYQQIPLTPDPNQTFRCTLKVDSQNIPIDFKLTWNIQANYWVMTLIKPSTNNYYVDSIPLIAGVQPTINILQPYSYLKIGSCYIINISGINSDYPTNENLGIDYIMLWGDTESV